METTLNDEEKARQIRGAEREGQRVIDLNCDSQPGLEGISSGGKSFGANRNDGPTKFSFGNSEEVTGKVIDELIHECLNQLGSKKQEIRLLESKLENLNALRNELLIDNKQDT